MTVGNATASPDAHIQSSSSECGTSQIVVLVLVLGNRRCGVPADHVIEVLPAAQVEPVPGAPGTVLGALDLRGELLAVIDGRRCLGVEGAPLHPRHRFVVVAVGDQRRVLRADAVDDLVSIRRDDVVSASSLAPDVASSAGIARLADGLLLIQDPGRFLSHRDTVALDRALDAMTATVDDGGR
jgi:purine-binding chemotaxis protein CheW